MRCDGSPTGPQPYNCAGSAANTAFRLFLTPNLDIRVCRPSRGDRGVKARIQCAFVGLGRTIQASGKLFYLIVGCDATAPQLPLVKSDKEEVCARPQKTTEDSPPFPGCVLGLVPRTSARLRGAGHPCALPKPPRPPYLNGPAWAVLRLVLGCQLGGAI